MKILKTVVNVILTILITYIILCGIILCINTKREYTISRAGIIYKPQ